MKLTTPLIVLGIVIALVAVYFSGIIPDFNDAVDDVGDDIIDPTPAPTDDYPAGWNVPGNVNHIELTMQTNGQIKMFYYHQGTNADETQYCAAGIAWLKVNLYQWDITDTQLACGLAQLDVM
jgi:hypothetical protein